MRKKGFLIATSAGFAAAAAPGAQAADMPIKAPRYVEPAADWTGWYIGAHAGAAWQHANFVFGLEGDISGLSNKNRGVANGYAFTSRVHWLSTVRGRFGLAVGD